MVGHNPCYHKQIFPQIYTQLKAYPVKFTNSSKIHHNLENLSWYSLDKFVKYSLPIMLHQLYELRQFVWSPYCHDLWYFVSHTMLYVIKCHKMPFYDKWMRIECHNLWQYGYQKKSLNPYNWLMMLNPLVLACCSKKCFCSTLMKPICFGYRSN